MKKTQIILYTLLLVCIVTFAGCVGFLASALLYEKEPPKAPEQENAEPTPAPDPAPEVKPESDREPDPEPDPFANISFELADASVIQDVIDTLRVTVITNFYAGYVEDDIAVITDPENLDSPRYGPLEIYCGRVYDSRRQDAVDTKKAILVKKDMPLAEVYALIGNPHSYRNTNILPYHEYKDTFSYFVLDNGQILCITYRTMLIWENGDLLPEEWFVYDLALYDPDPFMEELKKLGIDKFQNRGYAN